MPAPTASWSTLTRRTTMGDLSIFDLEGLGAAVTGGAMGIGAGIADALHRAGASVVMIDKDAEAAERTASSIGTDGAKVHVVHADVSGPEDTERAVDAAATALGSLDILVNNAGIYPTRPIH